MGLGDLTICLANELVPNSLNGRIAFLKEATIVPVSAGLSRVFLDQVTQVGMEPVTV